MDEPRDAEKDSGHFKGPGGTPGGVGQFLLGLGLFVVGAYLVMSRVTIYGAFPRWFGDNTFGITLIPFLLGLGLLFFNGRSIAGWILAASGLAIIFAGIIASLSLAFEPTSLFATLVIFGLMAAGAGLMARALRSQ